jgi:bacillithiol system protein YtxJ
MMQTQFEPVDEVGVLDELIERSNQEPVILFNHDPYCPISGRAFEEVAQLTHDVALVDVARRRDVTREIQQRTGVRHESPQVIVLRHGRPVWHASHFRIAADAVEAAVSQSA